MVFAIRASIWAFVMLAGIGSSHMTLEQRLLRPNEMPGYGSIIGHESLRQAEDLSEEIKSLCVKIESPQALKHSGFISGYEESLGDKTKTGGVAFSIVGQFGSPNEATTFLRHDDSLCGGRPTRSEKVTKLNAKGIPGAIGYRLGSGSPTPYWMMFAAGPYVYAEGMLGSSGAREFTTGVERLYRRVSG